MARAETTARRTRIVPLLLGAFVLVFMTVAAPGARAGDADLAKFLLKGAKDDLAKKQYDAAKSKLERAETEDPCLLEAIYWQAVVAERRGESRAAAPIYQRFVEACGAKAKDASAAASKEETGLLKEAQKRLEALVGGELERRKLDDAFVGALMAFAEGTFVKDPPIASKALRILLSVRPDHAAARGLLEKMGEPVPELSPPAAETEGPAGPIAAGGGPFKAVKEWEDYLKLEWFGTSTGCEYRDGLLAIDVPGRGGLALPPTEPMGPRYAVEAEVRLVEAYEGKDAGIGFAFGWESAEKMYMLLIDARAAVLFRAQGADRGDQFRVDLSPPGVGTFHRLGVIVRDAKIEVWVDGKRVTEITATGRSNLSGEVALFRQNCKAEVRALRRGALP